MVGMHDLVASSVRSETIDRDWDRPMVSFAVWVHLHKIGQERNCWMAWEAIASLAAFFDSMVAPVRYGMIVLALNVQMALKEIPVLPAHTDPVDTSVRCSANVRELNVPKAPSPEKPVLTTAAAQENRNLPFAETDAATARDAGVQGAVTGEARLASDGVVGSIDPRWVAAVQSPASSGKIDQLAEELPPHSGCLQTARFELLLAWGPQTE